MKVEHKHGITLVSANVNAKLGIEINSKQLSLLGKVHLIFSNTKKNLLCFNFWISFLEQCLSCHPHAGEAPLEASVDQHVSSQITVTDKAWRLIVLQFEMQP